MPLLEIHSNTAPDPPVQHEDHEEPWVNLILGQLPPNMKDGKARFGWIIPSLRTEVGLFHRIKAPSWFETSWEASMRGILSTFLYPLCHSFSRQGTDNHRENL